jgi:hypothetical protein
MLPDQESYPVIVQVKKGYLCNIYLAYHLYKDSLSAVSNQRLYHKMGSFVQECRDLSALSPAIHMVVVCIAVYHRNSIAAERWPKRVLVGMIRAPRNQLAIPVSILSDQTTLIELQYCGVVHEDLPVSF